jgi:hypothetical protein
MDTTRAFLAAQPAKQAAIRYPKRGRNFRSGSLAIEAYYTNALSIMAQNQEPRLLCFAQF